MSENSFTPVKIIHPQTGGVAEVPDTSLHVWYRSGWRRLMPDDMPPPEVAAGEPPPLSQGQVEAAKQEALAQQAAAAADDVAAKATLAKADGPKTSGSGPKNTKE
jgi:hypothetical protein